MPDSALRTPPALSIQIAALFCVMALVLTLLFVAIFSGLARRHTQQRNAIELLVIARSAARLMSEELYERSREVGGIAKSASLWRDGLDSGNVVEMLAHEQAIDPDTAWIGVVDLRGVVKAATGDVLVGHCLSSLVWLEHLSGDLFVHDRRAAQSLGQQRLPGRIADPLYLVNFAAPIQFQSDVLGVLSVQLNRDWARRIVERILLNPASGDGPEVFIFDRLGELIYAPGERTRVMRDAAKLRPAIPLEKESAKAASDAEIVAWKDGNRYLTTAVTLPPRSKETDLGWQVVARSRESTALHASQNSLPEALGLGAGIVAAFALCWGAWLRARRLGHDLYRVAKAACEVEAGNGGASIPVLTSSREAWMLSTTLQRMKERLLCTRAEMERQVQERTRSLEQTNRKLDEMARRDPLTGLLNRRGFQTQGDLLLALAQRNAVPLSALMLDADRFKSINDKFGHETGDAVLRFLADSMRYRLRSSDVLARWGGEEFAVLLLDVTVDAANAIAEHLRKAIAAETHGRWGRVTVSVGVAQAHGLDDSLDAIMRRADEALYASKGRGRNRVTAFGDIGVA